MWTSDVGRREAGTARHSPSKSLLSPDLRSGIVSNLARAVFLAKRSYMETADAVYLKPTSGYLSTPRGQETMRIKYLDEPEIREH
jgi:hypothetical protein